MGTRGLIAFRYKGYYYIKYNHMDSYPDGLGQDLVNAIPVSQEEFEKWLEVQRNFCELISSDHSGDYEKSSSPPENDVFIEWTYTYDLDNLAFVVDSQAHFSLPAIARHSDEWSQFLSLDARGERCLSLETPPSLIAKFVGSNVPFLGGDPVPFLHEFVPTSTVPPSTWSKPLTPHHRRLMLAQVNASIAETYSRLSNFHGYSASSVDAQDFAMSFLEAIVPNNQAIVANRQSPTLPTTNGPAPRAGSPWCWYRGCLILLATNLDNYELFPLFVQAVAARAKAKNLDRCTALLWSVHHVAVVEISGGSVSHSGPIPLLAAYGSDEKGFVNALHLLWHYLPYPRWRIVHERATSHGVGSSDFLPTEVVMKIMAITDQLHYPKYQFLSHSFFELWWKQPRVASFTILPDAEEIGDSSLCFNAHSYDANVPVKLRLGFLWGKKTGNIWRNDDEADDDGEPANTWWAAHERKSREGEFSRESTVAKYRVQRFYSSWSKRAFVARVKDQFSSQTDILLCEAQPA